MVILVEVNSLCLDPCSVLHRLGYSSRKLSLAHLATLRTPFDLCLVLGNFDRYHRKIKHLPLLDSTRRYSFQRGLTVRALLKTVHLYVLRMLNRFQRAPFVPRLPAAFLPTALAQTARCRFLQPITGGRLAAAAAVLGYLIRQCLHSGCQLLNHCDQAGNQLDDGIFSLQVSRVDIFTRRCHKSGHNAIVAGLYDLGKSMQPNQAEQLPWGDYFVGMA